MTDGARMLLERLKEIIDGVNFQACHGEDLKSAHELEGLKLVRWGGTSFGSNFYCITAAGKEALKC